MAGQRAEPPHRARRAWRPRSNGTAWLAVTVLLLTACEVRLRPIEHRVEYRSETLCAATPNACPWETLEAQARFAALVRCLLDGATVLRLDGEPADPRLRVAPAAPRYGYARQQVPDVKGRCPLDAGLAGDGVRCRVASAPADRITWAGCGAHPTEDERLRGGPSLTEADPLQDTTVVTGDLSGSHNGFPPPGGLGGPDHFYQFVLDAPVAVEIAAAANASTWSPSAGHRSPWQPGLYLLDGEGRVLDHGRIWRGGVTYVTPRRLPPGRYAVVVDSSPSELARGDGVYRLYLGIDRDHLGPAPASGGNREPRKAATTMTSSPQPRKNRSDR